MAISRHTIQKDNWFYNGFFKVVHSIQIKTCCPCSSHQGKEVWRIWKLISCFASGWPRLPRLLRAQRCPLGTRMVEGFPSTQGLGKLPTEENYGREEGPLSSCSFQPPAPGHLLWFQQNKTTNKQKRASLCFMYEKPTIGIWMKEW